MLSNKAISAPVRSIFTTSKNHNNVLSFSDVSAGSVYSDPDESFESLVPSDPRLSDFTVLKLLGVGGNSKVYLVQEKITSRLQALKVISKDERQGDFDDVLAEQRIQAKLSTSDSECFLPLISSWHDGNNFYLVTEYLGGGDMAFEMIRSKTFNEDRARFYIAEIVIALEALHSQKIVHRDIKPANIIFRADGHIVLGDFGYSKLFEAPTGRSNSPFDMSNPPEYISFDVTADSDSGSFLTEESYSTAEVCGTPYYMAPEQHLGLEYSFGVDYWGMGVMFYRMLTARMPFGGDAQNKVEIGVSVVRDRLQFLEDDNVSPAAQDLLHSLLAKNPCDRPSPQQIRGHAFFKGFSWDKAARHQLKAPWIPYISPPPKNPSSALVINEGVSYDISTDPFPQFRFTCSKPYQRRPQLPKETKDSRETFKKAGSFLESLFKKSPASKAPPPLKVLRPALRPLILPGMIVERSGSHPPAPVAKEKTSPLASGFLSGSSYSGYSQHIESPILKVVPLSQVVVVPPSPALGYGNPSLVSIVYPDAIVGQTGSRPTADSSSLAGSRPPAVSRPPASPLSPPVTRSRSTSVAASVTRPRAGSTVAPRSRSGPRAPLPGSRAPLPGSCPPFFGSRAPVPSPRGPVPVSCPSIPLSHRPPPVGSHPPRNTIGLEEYQGGPPGLPTSSHQVTKHKKGRQDKTPRNRNTGPRTVSNTFPTNRLGREVHSNVLLNGAGQKPRHTPSVPRTPGKPSRAQGQQNVHPNFGRSRAASPPSVSNDMYRPYPAFSPSVASIPGSIQGQPYVVKFDLIPDDMLIGRRHPAFSPSVPGAPVQSIPHDPQPIVQAGSITPSQVSNDTTLGRRRPSAPSVPGGSFPRGPQPVSQAPGRSRSVVPAIVSDRNRIESRRNFSTPSVSRVPGHPRDTQNVPRTRARSNTFAPSTPSTLRNGGPPLPKFIPPPVPVIPERFLRADDPQNVACSPPVLFPVVFCENPSLSVPNSSTLSNGRVPETSQEAPITLVSRFKSWMRRLFSRGHPELTIRRGPEPTN